MFTADNDKPTRSTAKLSTITVEVRIITTISSTHSTPTHHHHGHPESHTSTDAVTQHGTTESKRTTAHYNWTVLVEPAPEVVLEFIRHYHINSPLAETIEALYLLNTLFKAFLDAIHPLLRFALLQWRQYQESCITVLPDVPDIPPAVYCYSCGTAKFKG